MNPRGIALPLLVRLAGLGLALTVAAALLALLGAGRAAAQGSDGAALDVVAVRVLPSAEVSGEVFTLGEVAELDGFDLDLVRRVAAVELGRSPRPGQGRRLSASYLRSRLRGEVDLERVRLDVPDGARVTRAAQVIAADEIERRVLDFAAGQAGVDAQALEQEVVSRLRDVTLPRGEVRWEIETMGRGGPPGTSRSFQVALAVDGESVWRGLVRVEQRIHREVVVARRAIARGTLIEADDVALERREVGGRGAGEYITALDTVVGARALQAIGAGERVRAGEVRRPADVKEGARVTLVFRTERLLFRAPGVAMVRAQRGDFIPVRNLDSGKVVYGVVEAGDVVKVN